MSLCEMGHDKEESVNPKTPYGQAKPSIALIPGTALVVAAKVHELGAEKYGPFNWRTLPKIEAMVYLNAALRHLFSFIDGEDLDPESNQTHLAHAIACCNIIIDANAVGNLYDDRPAKAPTAQLIRNNTRQTVQILNK